MNNNSDITQSVKKFYCEKIYPDKCLHLDKCRMNSPNFSDKPKMSYI